MSPEQIVDSVRHVLRRERLLALLIALMGLVSAVLAVTYVRQDHTRRDVKIVKRNSRCNAGDLAACRVVAEHIRKACSAPTLARVPARRRARERRRCGVLVPVLRRQAARGRARTVSRGAARRAAAGRGRTVSSPPRTISRRLPTPRPTPPSSSPPAAGPAPAQPSAPPAQPSEPAPLVTLPNIVPCVKVPPLVGC